MLAIPARRAQTVLQSEGLVTPRRVVRESRWAVTFRPARPGRETRVSGSLGPCYSSCVHTELVPGVTADPAVAFGKPVIAGTRLPVAVVLGRLAAGVSEAELCAEYDLRPEQIQAALRYAAWLASQESVRVRAG